MASRFEIDKVFVNNPSSLHTPQARVVIPSTLDGLENEDETDTSLSRTSAVMELKVPTTVQGAENEDGSVSTGQETEMSWDASPATALEQRAEAVGVAAPRLLEDRYNAPAASADNQIPVPVDDLSRTRMLWDYRGKSSEDTCEACLGLLLEWKDPRVPDNVQHGISIMDINVEDMCNAISTARLHSRRGNNPVHLYDINDVDVVSKEIKLPKDDIPRQCDFRHFGGMEIMLHLMLRLAGLRGIHRLFGFYKQKHSVYILQQYLSVSIEDSTWLYIDREEACWRLLLDIGIILKALKTVGIVHLDVKYDNIRMEDGVYHLFDWGHAQFTSQDLPPKRGTVLYAAPEIWFEKGIRKDPQSFVKADIYSLAVTCLVVLRILPGSDKEKMRQIQLEVNADNNFIRKYMRGNGEERVTENLQNILYEMLQPDVSARTEIETITAKAKEALGYAQDANTEGELNDEQLPFLREIRTNILEHF